MRNCKKLLWTAAAVEHEHQDIIPDENDLAALAEIAKAEGLPDHVHALLLLHYGVGLGYQTAYKELTGEEKSPCKIGTPAQA